jgi:hypothetical protein
MSSISSSKEQQELKVGIQALRGMAYERIAEKPKAYLDKLEELFFQKHRTTACSMIFAMAGIDERDRRSKQQQSSRPSFIARWAAEIEQQDKEIAEKEAAAAQQAASAAFTQSCMDAAREAVTGPAKPGAAAQKQSSTIDKMIDNAVSSTGSAGNIGSILSTSSIESIVNTITNEIGLPEGFNPAVKPKPMQHEPFNPAGTAHRA